MNGGDEEETWTYCGQESFEYSLGTSQAQEKSRACWETTLQLSTAWQISPLSLPSSTLCLPSASDPSACSKAMLGHAPFKVFS